MTDLTPDQLDDLIAKAKAATPGPWEWKRYKGRTPLGWGGMGLLDAGGETILAFHDLDDITPDRWEEEYIAAAAHPGVVIALAEEVKRLREDMEGVSLAVAAYKSTSDTEERQYCVDAITEISASRKEQGDE